jgi:hypothetical protein
MLSLGRSHLPLSHQCQHRQSRFLSLRRKRKSVLSKPCKREKSEKGGESCNAQSRENNDDDDDDYRPSESTDSDGWEKGRKGRTSVR